MIQKHILEYYVWDEIEQFLEQRLEKKLDDYYGYENYRKKVLDDIHSRYGESWYYTRPAEFTSLQLQAHDEYERKMNNAPEKCNFWDWWNDCVLHDIPNGAYWLLERETCIELKEMYCHETWIYSILSELILLFDEIEEEEITVYYSW